MVSDAYAEGLAEDLRLCRDENARLLSEHAKAAQVIRAWEVENARLHAERDGLKEKLAAFEGMLDTIHVAVANMKIQRERLTTDNARLREAAKTGLQYVIAAEHSISTQPNAVSKDADLIRRALREQE